MSFRIVMDSCGELTQEMKETGCVVSVPLTIRVDNEEIVDDESFNQAECLRKIRDSVQCPSSSCPAPGEYTKKYDCGADRVYVVTLSAQLSGSYNSARVGRELFLESNPDAQVAVIDSKSAAAGETLLAHKILEWEGIGLGFTQIVQNVNNFIKKQKTTFMLEDLSILQKNGRLTGIKALLARTLNILPIMGATPEGTICQLGQARGHRRAFAALLSHITEDCKKLLPKDLFIAHCNCFERARELKQGLVETFPKLIVHILDTRGISTLYANDRGLVVSY